VKLFNLSQALEGKLVVTRDGSPVHDLHVFPSAPDRVWGVLAKTLISWSREGKFNHSFTEHHTDLFMGTVKKKGWLNVSPTDPGDKRMAFAGPIFETRERAMLRATAGMIDCIEVEWEE